MVTDENGEPKDWVLYNYSMNSQDNSKNIQIAESYARHIAGRYCGHTGSKGVTDCINLNPSTSFKVLNGENAKENVWYGIHGVYHYTYQYSLNSGDTLALLFAHNPSGGIYYPLIHRNIRILYILDVNGIKNPNQIGRDIYYFMLKENENKIIPYYDGDSDCKNGGFGYSCAYDIIRNSWRFPKDYPY